MHKFPISKPIDLIFGKILPFDVQLIILDFLDLNERTNLLINHFLLTKYKFNVFKNKQEIIIVYWSSLINSKDPGFSFNMIKYCEIIKVDEILSNQELFELLTISAKNLNLKTFEQLFYYLYQFF